MTKIFCQFVKVGHYCVCGADGCGRIIPTKDIASGDCDGLVAWCKSDPNYKQEMNRLRNMSRVERDAHLAELRASGSSTEPSMARQAWKYSEALMKWAMAGSPTRSQERIEEILQICKTCPFYVGSGERPRCKLCGCSVNKSSEGVKNKIAMATEACPLDPPKWLAEA